MRLLLVLVAVAMAGCDSGGGGAGCVPTDDAGNPTACWGRQQLKAAASGRSGPLATMPIKCDKPQVVYVTNPHCNKAADDYWESSTDEWCLIVPDGCVTGLCVVSDGSNGGTCYTSADCLPGETCRDFSTF